MTDPPREITGSAGSRIRLIFGDTGSEWLLLLNNDDGTTEWQSSNWKGIPCKLATQLNNCTAKGRYVKEVDFGPAGAWYVYGIKRDGSGGHSWWGSTSSEASEMIQGWCGEPSRVQVVFGADDYQDKTYALIQGRHGYWISNNLDADLATRIERINKRKKAIKFVRLFHNNGYFISDDEGTEWKGVGVPCGKELKNGSPNPEDVAVAGDGSWVIIRPNTFESSRGVDEELTRSLSQFYRDQKERKRKRSQKIQEYHARIQRERTEREERERREEQERVAREEREREERERQKREEKLRAEKEAREAEMRDLTAAKVASLQISLETRLLEEAKSIKEDEAHFRKRTQEDAERLQKRKQSLLGSIDTMSPELRSRIDLNLCPIGAGEGATNAVCVVCHMSAPSHAVVPCGHHCLCDDCADVLRLNPPGSRLCPLCRGNLQSTLKIFSNH